MPKPNENAGLGKEIFSRIVAMLINEAADAFYMGIGSKEDIDLAMTKGVNYPKGLLKWADELGIENICQQLRHLQDAYGDDRYRQSILLKRMVVEKKRFYA